MSPEQIRGKSVDNRADIYSFGATIFEMVVGHPPFTGSTESEILRRHLVEPARSLKQFKPNVTPPFDDLVRRMLQKSPADRPRSMDEVVRACRPRGFSWTRKTEAGSVPGETMSGNLDFEKPIMELEKRILELESKSQERKTDLLALQQMREDLNCLIGEIFSKLTAWERVQVARHPERPQTADYLAIFDDFVELHGDRYFQDDPAIKAGIGKLDGRTVVVIGQHKGKDTRQRLAANYGMPNPEGYRKALRLMKLAEKMRFPVICLIDTPGAFPGIGAEERGQFSAIAVNLMEMSRLKTPVVGVILAEGGSGGALGIAVVDRLLIFENAWFSVISPEGCAAILFKSSEKDKIAEAAEALRLTALDLLSLGVVDEVVPEPMGGAHRDARAAAETLRAALKRHLADLDKLGTTELVEKRYAKWRAIGRVAGEA